MQSKYFVITFIILLTLTNGLNAQNKKTRVLDCSKFNYGEFNLSEIKLKDNENIDLGSGFKAYRDCNSLIVKVPGKYLDTLSGGPSSTISIQIAAFVFIKTCKTNEQNVEECLKNCFIKVNNRKLGSGLIVDEYLFKTKNSNIVHIFTYLNDYDGLLSVIEINL